MKKHKNLAKCAFRKMWLSPAIPVILWVCVNKGSPCLEDCSLIEQFLSCRKSLLQSIGIDQNLWQGAYICGTTMAWHITFNASVMLPLSYRLVVLLTVRFALMSSFQSIFSYTYVPMSAWSQDRASHQNPNNKLPFVIETCGAFLPCYTTKNLGLKSPNQPRDTCSLSHYFSGAIRACQKR